MKNGRRYLCIQIQNGLEKLYRYKMMKENGDTSIRLVNSSNAPMTTEQALRRLKYLGFTIEDECIQKAVEYMDDCLTGRKQLLYVVKWLQENKNANDKWDMGNVVNDKVYFPLSDSWRKAEIREADCTERINKILNKLK